MEIVMIAEYSQISLFPNRRALYEEVTCLRKLRFENNRHDGSK
jgi:hypothetical protein